MSEADRPLDKERRRRFLSYFNGPPYRGDRARFMQDTKISKGRVSQYFDENQPFGERAAIALAIKLDLAEDAFLVDEIDPTKPFARFQHLVDVNQVEVDEEPPLEAQSVSHPIATLQHREPPTFEWRELKLAKIAKRFRTQMPDASMDAGRSPIPKGRWLVFEKADAAPDGRRAIVRLNGDKAQIYVRRVKEVDGGWLAKPDDPDFDTFDSRKAQLEVIALLHHIEMPDET